MKTLLRAVRYMAPYWHWQVAALFTALVVAASGFVWPLTSKWVVNGVFMPGPSQAERLATMWWAAKVAAITVAVGALLGPLRAYLFARVSERTAADLRVGLFRHMHLLPMRYFDARQTGGVMSVLQNDVEALQVLYASTFVDVITNLLTVAVAIGFMVHTDPLMAAEALPVPVLFGVVLAVFGEPLHTTGRTVRDNVGGVQEVLQESASGVREVKVFVRSESELSRYAPRLRTLIRSRVRQSVLGAANWSAANVVAWGGMTLVMVIASLRVIDGRLDAGSAVMFTGVLGMLFGPAGAVTGIYNQIMGALGAADRVFEFLDEPTEVEAPAAPALPAVRGRVQFDQVCFQYEENGPQTLCDITLDIAPGEMVALVGPSGAGKTTLVSLLPRLYDVTSGRVCIDGVEVRDVTLASLRHTIAIVPQEPFLFGTTVRENIAFGKEGAAEEEIVAAARAANAHEFVTSLPEGYNTQVGERGTRLSVGQKQRLAIARAILRDPRILILDEATSAQDSESERLVQEAMGRLMEGRTSFVIAHRLSTVLRADRIVVLEGGRVTQTGSHSELLAMGGTYARLHALQFATEA